MIHIVTGPPGAGKNTFINAQMRTNEMLIDLDAIYAAISNSNPHVQKNAVLLQIAMCIRSDLFGYVRNHIKSGNVWIAACMPNGRKREMFARTFTNSKVYLIKPSKQVCLEHIRNDKRRLYPIEYAEKIVFDWYKAYTPSAKDIKVCDLFDDDKFDEKAR